MFTACLAYGYIPKAWRKTRMTFIQKPGNASYTEANAYCPVCLSSLLLNTMEKLVDRYIRDDMIRDRPQHRNQFAYQAGRSTETAIHNVLMRIENKMAHKEIALGAILDIEVAFDRTSYAIIIPAAARHGVGSTIVSCTNTMLQSRGIIAMDTFQVYSAGAACFHP
jgi:hypothetical protein